MTWQRKCNRVRFVNEDEILIHPFRIDRTLKHEQVFRADDAMLHPGLEVKLSAGPEDFDRKRSLVKWTPEDKTCAFADFEALVLLLVHLEREISAFAHDEIFFDARMLVQCDDNAAPASANHPIVRLLDAIKQFRKLFRFANPVRKRFTPKATGFAAVAVKRLARFDRRERAQLLRDASEARIRRKLRVVEIKARFHQCPPEVETVTAPSALLSRVHVKP